MKFVFIAILAVLNVIVTVADPRQQEKTSDNTGKAINKRSDRYCGPKLVESMRLVCNSNYKRSDDGEGDIILGPSPKRLDSLGFPFRSASRSMYLVKGGARWKRGILEECCYNPCTLNELRTYCGSRTQG